PLLLQCSLDHCCFGWPVPCSNAKDRSPNWCWSIISNQSVRASSPEDRSPESCWQWFKCLQRSAQIGYSVLTQHERLTQLHKPLRGATSALTRADDCVKIPTRDRQ